MNTVVRILDRAAHLAKSRACVIADLFLGNNAAPDLVVQICQRLQGSEVAFQGIGLLPILSPAIGLGSCRYAAQGADLKQLHNSERAADFEALDRSADILHAGEGDTSLGDNPHLCVTRLLKRQTDRVHIRHGSQAAAHILASAGRGVLFQFRYDFLIFQCS